MILCINIAGFVCRYFVFAINGVRPARTATEHRVVRGGCGTKLQRVDAFSLSSAAGQEIIPLKDVRLKIEQHATDKDAGKQVFLDADPWQSNFASGKLVAEVVEKD